jgi:hypothetical protein
MTNEPDNKPGRRPPTIELTATEGGNQASKTDAATAKPGSGSTAADSSSNPPIPPKRRFPLSVIAAAGLVAAIAILAGLWKAGLLPLPQTSAATAPAGAPTPTAALKNPSDAALVARLDKIEQRLQTQQSDPALAKRLAAAEAQAKSLADSLAALSGRFDKVAAASDRADKAADAAQATAAAAKSASEDASKRAASQNTGQDAVQRADLDALSNRIAALETATKNLSDDAARHASGDKAARLTIAAQALRAAVEHGAPYQAELAAVKSLGADQSATAPLEPFAADGIASADALGYELAALIPALRRASDTSPGENTFIGRLEANAQRLVRVTPVDAPAGNNPAAVVTRIDIDAAHADIAGALADIALLPEQAKPLADDWVKKAQARNAALAVSRAIAADALAALAKPAAQ